MFFFIPPIEPEKSFDLVVIFYVFYIWIHLDYTYNFILNFIFFHFDFDFFFILELFLSAVCLLLNLANLANLPLFQKAAVSESSQQ